jgi:SWI/SNF-related matrix-associated actin-dependent regulator 1 of chromatin subfamily A
MNTTFDDLLAGISNPAITAEKLGIDSQPISKVATALPLYDFQEEAVDHVLRDVANHGYAYVGLDMGLGKTPVGLATAAAVVASGATPVLIVVPPSLRVNWVREVEKFTPWLSVDTITGSKPNGDPIPDTDVIVMGDSSVSGWADTLKGNIAALIVDEAHRFKNKSKRSKGLVELAASVPSVRVLMSGTPTPNGRHTELVNQVDILGQGAWRDIGGKGQFYNYYAPKVDQFSRTNAHGDELFEAMSSTWFHRRLKNEVLELPNKGRTDLHIEAQGPAIREYKQVEEDLIAWLAGKQGGEVTAAQRRAEALIQLTTLRRLAGECKVKGIVAHVSEILDNEPGGIFIVGEHRKVMEDLVIALGKYEPTAVWGGLSDAEKAWEVDQFNSGKSRVMVGQVTAAGVGLTLHGDGLNHRVVVAQLPWTPADLKQAEDRLHRIGQTHDVDVEITLAAMEGTWTIDERLWSMLEMKNYDSSMITDGHGEWLLSDIQEGLLDSYR